jgi:hypothetical protein
MMFKEIQWTEYMKYKIKMRGFDFSKIEHILRYSNERYIDTATNRLIVIGKHEKFFVLIPYEKNTHSITPITIHVITRQQINFRVKTGRFRHE